ncbi:HD-GYP domain-containing protein [Massilia sp. TWP1-3-3]|uniref:HD-GYP domain-containing protein n=1 Tax=Massilia sp. TWP1-3-3 TaxID=2804573 RepID=UPI003CF44FFC
MDSDFKATVLVVDDASDKLLQMEQLLRQRYHVRLAHSGADALHLARQAPHPDLVLLAMDLPDMDGFAVLRGLKSNVASADIAVMFLTAGEPVRDDEARALREGAADIMARASAPGTLLARVDTHAELRAARRMLGDRQRHLAHLVAERMREADQMQDAIIIALASLAESRDLDAGNHIRRTQHFVAALARELRFHTCHWAELSDDNIALLFKAAPLHDIGMVGVPDAIVRKSGKLTGAEFEQMKLHTVFGRDAIAGVARTLGASNAFLRYAGEITYSHQEHWDGSGYPQALAGAAIPLSARLMAVADVYDALISERPYRPAFTHETAVELIRQERGEHFDPDVVDALLAIAESFKSIALQFQA